MCAASVSVILVRMRCGTRWALGCYAVSALLGLCVDATYEGEPAIVLDAARAAYMASLEQAAGDEAGAGAVAPDVRERYAITVTKNAATEQSTAHDTSVVLFDAAQTLQAVLDDLQLGVPVGAIALRFHDAIVGAVVQAAELVRAVYDINLVALSGGCFMNRYLFEESARALGERGFTVAVNGNLPPNDGCVSYGQAVVASASR